MTAPSPDALWQQAQSLAERGDFEAAQIRLQAAAEAGHALACFRLGAARIADAASADDCRQGLDWLLHAEHHGVAAAMHLLAVLGLGDVLQPLDWPLVAQRLQRAAQAGFPPALRSVALALAQRDDAASQALANLCLEHAAMGGDLVSLALLGERLARGQGGAVDCERAAAIAGLLQNTDLPVAAPARAVDPSRAEPRALPPLPTLPVVDLQALDAKPQLTALSQSPAIAQAEAALSAEECRFVQFLGSVHLQPSITAAPDGQILKVPLRTSHDAAFTLEREDVWLRMIQRRMAAAAGLPLAHGEPLILLRYAPGQEYRPHRDYLPPSLVEPIAQGGPGQRVATVIAYLNGDVRGGATVFPEQGLRIAPNPGRLLHFRNLSGDDQPDTRTLHAGEPVQSGIKWICTLWVRQGRYRLA